MGQTVIALMAIALVSPTGGLFTADPIRDSQWHLSYLDVAEAHEHSSGEGVIVGVVDTGVDGNHPDLLGSLLPGVDLTGGTGKGSTDVDGHGTLLAGLIVAHGRALGVAPDAQVLPVRNRISFEGAGSATAVDWAVDHDATVLCLAYTEEDSQAARRAIQRAVESDVVVVAAVGNAPLDNLVYPVGYPGVVGAAGVDRAGNHAAISLPSPFATLAAPAVDIVAPDSRTVSPTGYSKAQGTSAATAIIAGAAALVRSKFPNLSAREVIHRLTATADDKGPPGRDDLYGYGVINILKALTADIPPLQSSTAPAETPIAEPAQGVNPRTIAIIGAITLAALLGAGLLARSLARRRDS